MNHSIMKKKKRKKRKKREIEFNLKFQGLDRTQMMMKMVNLKLTQN